MFYGKLASDMMLNREFAKATSEFTIKFAAEHGYMFTDHDLLVAGQTMQGFAKQFGNDVKQLHQYHLGTVGKAALRAVGQAVAQAPAQGAKAAGRTGNPGGLSPSQANSIMSGIEMDRMMSRIGDVIGGMSGTKKKSG
jgi:hypothetical protein